MNKLFYLFIFAIITLNINSSYAQNKVETNIPGVIIKNVRCSGSMVIATISNRSNNEINHVLLVTVFDKDGDPVGNGSNNIRLGPVSGEKIYVTVGSTCDDNSRYAFRFK